MRLVILDLPLQIRLMEMEVESPPLKLILSGPNGKRMSYERCIQDPSDAGAWEVRYTPPGLSLAEAEQLRQDYLDSLEAAIPGSEPVVPEPEKAEPRLRRKSGPRRQVPG